nr:hypothetical protein [uncultured Tyzzerella sp.]
MYKENEYFSPEILVSIGSYTFSKYVTLNLKLDIDKNFDFAIIKFSEKILDEILINKDDEVVIQLGYNNELEKIFTGYVTDVKDFEIIAKNKFLNLVNININKSFTNATFDEILKFILNQANIQDMTIKSDITVIKNLISIKNKNGLDSIKYLEQKFNIKDSLYFFKNDKFLYNDKEKQQESYELIYGNNILNLQNLCPKVWEVETISMPKLNLLDNIYIEHYKLTGTFKVEKINFIVNDYGFIRTKITIRE